MIFDFSKYLLKIKSSTRKHSLNPVFNERLIITELFPPLCQRIQIEIFHGESFKIPLHASHSINLRFISNDNDQGFLPTFGPAFIHFYSGLDGFVGSLLLGIEVRILDETAKALTLSESIPNFDDFSLYLFSEIYLMGIILNASAIYKSFSNKPVSFQMTFGENNVDSNIPSTSPLIVEKINKNYGWVNFKEKVPFLTITHTRADCTKRMYLCNMLAGIISEMVPLLEFGKFIIDIFKYSF